MKLDSGTHLRIALHFMACLQDHPACLSSFIVNEEAGPISVTDEIYGPSGRLRLKAVLNWLVRRRGPLTTTGCDHGAFVNTLGEREPAHLASARLLCSHKNF